MFMRHQPSDARERPSMASRILRALAWRTFWRTEIRVFCATDRPQRTPPPPGFSLVHWREDRDGLAEEAMRAADEPPGLSAERFRNADEFFGWEKDGQIVSWGWVTFRDRKIGQSIVPAQLGWAFLYNFHTHPEYRGQGLYPQLLTAIIRCLTKSGYCVLIIDVNSRNKPSLHGIEKAGFIHVGSTSWVTVLRRWMCSHSLLRLDRVPPIVVGSTLSGGEHVGTSQEPGADRPGHRE